MYGGYGTTQNQTGASSAAQNTAASATTAPYNYDQLFGTAGDNTFNAQQQYQQYLNALSQYNQQTPGANAAASVAAGYGSMSILPADYAGTYSAATNTAAATGTEASTQFASFEQALRMQQQNQQQQQSFTKFQNPGQGFAGASNRKVGFGAPRPPQQPQQQQPFFGANKSFNTGFQKRNKGPPKPPVDPSKYYCDVCNIACGSPQAYQDHVAGKSHKRKDELAKGNAQPLAKNKASFKCEVCNVTCTGKEAFDTHINGIKHSRAMKNLQRMGKPIPENLSTVIPPSNPNPLPPGANNPDVKNGNGAGQPIGVDEIESDMADPIGEEFIESVPGGKTTQYKCKLCECSCGDQTAMKLHIRGRRHRLQYKQKVDSSIHVDSKPNSRNTKKTLKEKAPKIVKFPTNWSLYPPQAAALIPAMPDTAGNDSYDEQHVRAHLEQLRPDPKLIEETDKLIELIEKTLKKTSDVLTEKLCPQPAATTQGEQEAAADRRVLRGVIRTGILGDRLLLKSDRQVSAVLMCKDIPTVSLLQSIIEIFAQSIEDEELRSKTVVEAQIEDSGFSVKFKDGEMTAVIKLTSVALAEPDDASSDTIGKTVVKTERPKDVLDPMPLDPMRFALSEMRQTKFFQSQCWPVPCLCETVVLLRDLFTRIPAWNVLSLHAVQLLVRKTIVSSMIPLRVSDAFRRFFEVIASGQFMSMRSKLADPCEKDQVDLIAHLSRQHRENIMTSAQNVVRLLAYDQIHTVMGMERLPLLNRKRPNHEDMEVDENGVKKEKKEGSATPIDDEAIQS